MIRLGEASQKLSVGHNTIRDFLSEIGLPVDDNLTTELTERQCRKIFLEFTKCEPSESEMLFKEFVSCSSEREKQFGGTETISSVWAIPTPFETNVRKH